MWTERSACGMGLGWSAGLKPVANRWRRRERKPRSIGEFFALPLGAGQKPQNKNKTQSGQITCYESGQIDVLTTAKLRS